MGVGKTSPVSSVDVARAVAAILDDPAPHIGHIYDLTGPELADLDHYARVFSQALGRTIRYRDAPTSEWNEKLRAAGLSGRKRHTVVSSGTGPRPRSIPTKRRIADEGNRSAASTRPRPAGGHCPASDRPARSARTAPATAQPAPSRQETPLAASSWRSAQTPPSPASTASSPNPMQQSTPPNIIPRSLQLPYAEVP